VALWKLWEQAGGARPDRLAGHSLGEYTALTCAGVITLGDAVRLVRRRGELMQAAVADGEGRMAAILGLDDDQVRQACADAAQGEVVEAVNFNAPGQVVIAGQVSAVERAIEACKAAGAKRAMALPVSVPSHCALMRPAADKLAEQLQSTKFFAPELPVINNVDVSAESDPDSIRGALVRQLHSPVRWSETVRALAADGVSTLYECGPGKVLCGLTKRIDRGLDAKPLENDAAFQNALTGA
jgi:[acyl-carrier-protein] S-malonyltransferase